MNAPLTVGTAGHIDHGKTALVQALTGVDTDRLPEEKARGITIVLGFAPLTLPSGRVLSLVDVPGHERLLRVMVAGATGIDLFLLVVAADDGVMPQTREHLRVLDALGVRRGVVAVTKADLADPGPALAEAAELVPDGVELIACSARTGAGVGELAAALERAATDTASRAADPGPAVLHVDRVFTIRGAGTVVTGTLWSGVIRRGERLSLLPGQRSARVRGVQVHDRAVEEAAAGQRVAVNLTGLERRAVTRGDVLAGADAPISLSHRLEARLTLHERVSDRERVQVHHGTRATPARAVRIDGDLWQLRCERPLVAADGDRIVLRRIAPPDTLGGGVIVRAAAGGRRGAEAGSGSRAKSPSPPAPAGLPPLDAAALALEERLRAAGHEPPSEAELGDEGANLRALHAAGRAVRIGRSMHAHPDAIADVRAVVERIAQSEGQITLARLRDELATSRKYAQALLEHLDAARVTRRRPDDTRVLRSAPR
jgi:selenocysteine-specific elongation factor